MKKGSKILVALLAVVILVAVLAVALVACDANKDDKSEDVDKTGDSSYTGETGYIGESGYYEGKITTDELLTYEKAMFDSSNALLQITYGIVRDGYGIVRDGFDPIWKINCEFYDDEGGDVIIYVTDSNEAAEQLYQLEKEESSEEFAVDKVVGNRIIKETKQDLIKNKLLVGSQVDNIPDKFVNLMKSSCNEAMDNLSIVENSNDEDVEISIVFFGATLFSCSIPTASIGNCRSGYMLLTPKAGDYLEESIIEGIKESKKLIGTRYTLDSYIEDEEDYVLARIEVQPGFVFEDILDDNGNPTGEVAVVDYYYNSEEGRHAVIPSTDPNGKPVTYINLDNGMFDEDIETITIPTSIKAIGEVSGRRPENNLKDLKSINYLGDLKGWCEIEHGEGLQIPKLYVKQNGIDVEVKGDIIIPEGTTKIGDYAFYGLLTDITSVTIPDSVISIGDNAFNGCTGLKEVTIGKSVESIGDYAFYGTGLKEVTIGKSVESIGDYAFYGTGLTSITIPNSVTSIGEDAFSRCSNLKSISVDEGNATYQSKDGVVYKKDDKSLYLVPLGIEGAVTILDGCTKIDEYDFANCKYLTAITIPDSITSIGDSAFRGCTGLQTITIGEGVQTIPDYAFYYCTGLQTVTIGEGVTSIGYWAFYGCINLKEITIPDSVQSIGDYAFYGLAGITSVTIPDSVTSIGDRAFSECTNITTAIMPSNAISCIPQNSLAIVTITSGNIGDYAFYRCESLQTVTIGEGVTSIGERAFYRCTGLETVYYEGTSEQWDDISIGSDNEDLTRAERYYFSEQDPYANHTAKEGEQYWHWDEETHTPEVWVKQD